MTTKDIGPKLIWANIWPNPNSKKDRKHFAFFNTNGKVSQTTLCGAVIYRTELDQHTEGIKYLPLCQTCGWEARKLTCLPTLSTVSAGDGSDSSSEQATESTETSTLGEATTTIELATEKLETALEEARKKLQQVPQAEEYWT